MLASRSDITSRITAPILWYDEDGCPRYDPFEPGMCANIYAQEAVLVKIACQSCGQRFKVAISRSGAQFRWAPVDSGDLAKRPFPAEVMCKFLPVPRIADSINDLHYGDPPRHGCVGDTMNCEDLGVLEFWKKENMKWERDHEYEVQIQQDWREDES